MLVKNILMLLQLQIYVQIFEHNKKKKNAKYSCLWSGIKSGNPMS